MNHALVENDGPVVDVLNADGAANLVLVCEHASNFIPAALDGLGLAEAARISHVAWDPGALAVARAIARRLDARLVASCVSRLVYDCNRPPGAEDAMPARSEVFDIPGNAGLSAAERRMRTDRYYRPFEKALSATIASRQNPVVVTVHSFTPVYNGQAREVEIGVLHDEDARLADAMLDLAARHTGHIVRRNTPYGPADGVTHTLKEQALRAGYLNVMLEVRNDLIADADAQDEMARLLSGWIAAALDRLGGTP